MVDPLIHDTIVYFLAALFFYSGLQKWIHHRYFILSLAGYRLFPGKLVSILSFLIPLSEWAASLCLFFPGGQTYGLILALGLLGVFSLVIFIKLLQGEEPADCGCFGPGLKLELSWILLLRNLVLLGMSALSLCPQSHRPLTFWDQLFSPWITFVFCLTFAAWNRILSNNSLPLLKKKNLYE
uniref:Methylamine utilization protein n=1 Tax=Candidatus Methylacidiphilum infernorum TaxID=511746 RepID=A0A1W5LCP8_9BACT|nr:methylamine utilization protein [Candidatus Methylacidiphilum infernorum]